MSKHNNLALKTQREDNLVYLFHHIHHNSKRHAVHHPDGQKTAHDFEVRHCNCGLHSINKQLASGDTINEKLDKMKLIVEFTEKCPDGGWHLESGQAI